MEKLNEAPLPPAKNEKTFFYTLARGFGWLMANVFFPTTFHQREIMSDTDAPYILIANHLSLLDPILLAYACKKYEIRFLAKKELSRIPVFGAILRKLHIIPVDRHHSDMAAMRQCVMALREKRVLGIFPEGTRYHEDLMTPIETGTAVLALHARTKLVPAYIDRKARLFRRTNVYIGEPMDVAALCPEGFSVNQVQPLTDKIKARFLAMREETQMAQIKP